ncbi:MAG: dihydropteroate synthase [Elusimicrobia bacterium]|nr:dihydropteroate synthase [Elusimicrobiota bacterium]
MRSPRRCFRLRARGHVLDLGLRTCLMGVLNVTPDSFSGDGCCSFEAACRRGGVLIRQGADILDIGGESTRPGARRLSAREEAARVVPVIRRLSSRRIPLSIDSYKPQVIREALEAGASIVNVVQGTPVDDRILGLVRSSGAAIVLMHMRGTPRTMQTKTRYGELLSDVIKELEKSVERCLKIGIKKEAIIVDPGICFAKTVEQNFELIAGLGSFRRIGLPVLLGPSRKSFIGKTLDLPAEKRLPGTLAAVTAGILGGAHIVRVHDVGAVRQAATIADHILLAEERT